MSTFRHSLLVACAVLFSVALTTTAQATPIYNNLTATPEGDDLVVAPIGPLADSFSTGASAFTLESITVLLGGVDTNAGDFTMSLLNDSGTGQPGTLLRTVGTMSDDVLGAISPLMFTLGPPLVLAPNTRYWVELSSSTTSAVWAFSSDQNSPGVAGEFFFREGVVFSNDAGPYQMSVDGSLADVGVPVPEPGTLLSLGAGLIGLTRVARRRD